MKVEQLQQIRDWVLSFAHGLNPPDAPLAPALALKIEHTRHVAANARDIAHDLRWPPANIHLAEALGWVHDVGRFAQFAEFGHFHDATSFNHGLRGADIARESGILAELSEENRDCLLAGIRHHNVKTISPDTLDAHLPFLKLIRDADKLDIFRVVAEGLARNGFRELADMWPHIDLEGPVNPLLLRDIRARRDADVAHVHSLADFLLLESSWIYDLHYAPTRERVRRRGVLDILAVHLPDDPDTREVFGEIQHFLDTPESSAALQSRPQVAPC